ncbi:MAG: FCD domain-containing protein, partial [Chloroflexi bacterium]|nr:FCD domain-containing protein [Chloroflexota bacterium]
VYSSSLQDPDRARHSLAEHRALIAALRGGDAEAAERLARQHVERAEAAAMSPGFGTKTGVSDIARPGPNGGPSTSD